MDFRPLSSFVREFRTTASRLGRLRADDLRAAAADVAIQCYGLAKCSELPELINIAALALSLEQLVVHELRLDVPPLVDATDLHTIPEEPPRLLRRAWILESNYAHGEVLFGDTVSLGGYALDGVVYLVGFGLSGWARIARWTPRWTGEDLAESVEPEHSPLVENQDEHAGWTREAARFAIVLGLLLDAEDTPVGVADTSERPKGPPPKSKKAKPPPAWVTRYVSLRSRAHTAHTAKANDASKVREGLEATQREIRGHIKRQRYGPGGSLVKWIWIEAYGARRWIAPGPRRVVVKAGGT